MASTTTGSAARSAARARPGPVLAALGLAVLLLVAAVLMLVPSAAALAGLGLATGAAGVAVAVVALRRAAAAVAQAEKLSSEIDQLSGRLLKLEGAAPALPALPAPGAAEVQEVTAEIGLLGGIVRELAVAVEDHDRDIAELRDARASDRAEAERAEAARLAAARAAEEARRIVEARAAEQARIAREARAAEEARLAEAARAAERDRTAQAARPIPPPPRPAPAVEPPRPAPRVADAAALAPVQPVPVAPREPAASHEGDAVLERREAEIARALDEGQVEIFLQPIVTLPQRKVMFYEATPRLRLPDGLVPAAAFMGALERRGRVPDLDRLLVARAATIARHLSARGSGAAVAVGLAPVSAVEPGFLRSLSRMVETQADLAGRLVVTLPQRTWRALDAQQAGALSGLAARGAILALDRAIDLRFDPRALAERGIRYVKVPAELLLRPRLLPAAGGAGSDIAVGDLAAALSRAGIGLVADGVEREEDVPDLLDLDVPYAQGGAFAPPRAVRAEVLSPQEAAPPPPPAAPEEPAVAEEPPAVRRSFRDFLRRAG